jgi:hypothetical protein
VNNMLQQYIHCNTLMLHVLSIETHSKVKMYM